MSLFWLFDLGRTLWGAAERTQFVEDAHRPAPVFDRSQAPDRPKLLGVPPRLVDIVMRAGAFMGPLRLRRMGEDYDTLVESTVGVCEAVTT